MRFFVLQSAEDMIKFQLRHGNDLLAMDSIRESDVSLVFDSNCLKCSDPLVSKQGFMKIFSRSARATKVSEPGN